MNLYLILAFGEIGCIKFRDCWSEEQAKFDFLVTTVTTYRAKFKNHIFLNSDRNCLILVPKLKPWISSFGEY